jgi:hypothetical protein
MKNISLNFFILVFLTIILGEVVSISFKMMNTSNTFVFYMGLLIILISLCTYGYFGIKLVKKLVDSIKIENKKSEK